MEYEGGHKDLILRALLAAVFIAAIFVLTSFFGGIDNPDHF